MPRQRATISWLLIAPLFALVLFGFIVPIAVTLFKAVENPEVGEALPLTVAALEDWDGEGLPGEAAYAALAADILAADEGQAFGAMTRRLNFELTGLRTLFMKAKLRAGDLAPPYREALIAVDPLWGEPAVWHLLQRNADGLTPLYLLRALDLTLTPEGAVEAMPDDQAIFQQLFARTFVISAWVTLLCVLLGYPTAYWMSTLPTRKAAIAMLFVLIPFWTSILVRTTAWFILLQREGPINAFLQSAAVIDEPLTMIFTRFAVYVAMVHVLLPFLILPLYSVMKRMRPEYLRAAASLGAPPWRQFLHVYLPMTMPGVAAGALIVFMLSVGFYVTPALVGDLDDQMVSYYIAFFTNRTINLGMAAALATLLLVFTGLCIVAARRLAPGSGVRTAG